jgi:hypothetical protein
MKDGLGQKHEPQFIGGGLIRSQGGWCQALSLRQKAQKEEYDERILGSGDFVHAILKEAEEKERRQMKIRRVGLKTKFSSWLRTIRPGIPPSEYVTSLALRNSFPDFLSDSHSDATFAKFIIDKIDFSKNNPFRLAA